MIYRNNNINSLWGYLIVDELIRNGVTCFVISPGSRSTPLTIAAATSPYAETVVCLDERGAAFQALGYARGCGDPAALICTSGTAVANCFPAVVEAFQSNIPLLILSADRPPELRDTAANQTIDQVKIFGDYCNWQIDLPPPDESVPAAFVLTSVDQAVSRTRHPVPGPVQMNCMFREPLEPASREITPGYQSSLSIWDDSRSPYTRYHVPFHSTGSRDLTQLIEDKIIEKNGLLVVGQLSTPDETEAAGKICHHLKWPVMADIASGIREHRFTPYLQPYFDLYFLSERFSDRENYETVIQIGRPPTSKRFQQMMNRQRHANYMVVSGNPQRVDPGHVVTDRIGLSAGDFHQILASVLPNRPFADLPERYRSAHHAVEESIESVFLQSDGITEILTVRLIAAMMPVDSALFLAGSLPVREMDSYAGMLPEHVMVAANRGASGIDGTIAAAVGFARATGRHLTLVIGDLAFIHDVNSLHMLADLETAVAIVLINNGGGGIFSFLPVSGYPDVFEKFFATPHRVNFRAVAEGFGIPYTAPRTREKFREIYPGCLAGRDKTIIEIPVRRDETKALHVRIQDEIRARLDRLIE